MGTTIDDYNIAIIRSLAEYVADFGYNQVFPIGQCRIHGIAGYLGGNENENMNNHGQTKSHYNGINPI